MEFSFDTSRYLPLFLEEAASRLTAISEGLTGPMPDPLTLRHLHRHLHALRGMAAALGYESMRTLAAAAEELVASAHLTSERWQDLVRPLLEEARCACEGNLASIAQGKAVNRDLALEVRLGEALAEITRPKD